MTILWKTIQDHPNYSVSNSGLVRNDKTGRIMKQCRTSYNQCSVSLRTNKKSSKYMVSRLVAQAFIPNPDNKPWVTHLSEKYLDHSVDNLVWVTPQELSGMVVVRKLTDQQVLDILTFRYVNNFNLRKLSAMYEVSISTIKRVCYGIYNEDLYNQFREGLRVI